MIFENQSVFNQLNNFVCLHVSNIFAFTVGFIQCSCNEHLLVIFIVKVTVCVFAFPARLRPMHYDRVHRLTSTHHNVNSIFNALKIIVEQSRKREIKSRMSISFMLLLFKVHIRNKSFQVPARSESFYSLIIIDVVSL